MQTQIYNIVLWYNYMYCNLSMDNVYIKVCENIERATAFIQCGSQTLKSI